MATLEELETKLREAEKRLSDAIDAAGLASNEIKTASVRQSLRLQIANVESQAAWMELRAAASLSIRDQIDRDLATCSQELVSGHVTVHSAEQVLPWTRNGSSIWLSYDDIVWKLSGMDSLDAKTTEDYLYMGKERFDLAYFPDFKPSDCNSNLRGSLVMRHLNPSIRVTCRFLIKRAGGDFEQWGSDVCECHPGRANGEDWYWFGPDVQVVQDADTEPTAALGIFGLTHAELLSSPWVEDDALTVRIELQVETDAVLQVPPSTILTDIASLLEDGRCSDITFVIEGNHLQAHSAIVCARSRVLERVVNCGMCESASKQIVVEDCNLITFKVLLHFLYTDDFSQVEERLRTIEADCSHAVVSEEEPYPATSFLQTLLAVCHKYEVVRLQLWCMQQLQRRISVRDVCSILRQAYLVQAQELQADCLAFIHRNMPSVVVTPMFGNLSAMWPDVVLEINLFAAGLSAGPAAPALKAYHEAKQKRQELLLVSGQDTAKQSHWDVPCTSGADASFQRPGHDQVPETVLPDAAVAEDAEVDACKDASNSQQASIPSASTHKDEEWKEEDEELTELSTVLQRSETEALQLEQEHLQLAVLRSKEDAFNSEQCELVRLTKVSRAVHNVLLSSDSLSPCRQEVVMAYCEVQPEWAGGAILLVPMNHEAYKELGWEMQSHHVFLLQKDKHLLEAALKALPCRKRSSICENHCASKRDEIDGLDENSESSHGSEAHCTAHGDGKDNQKVSGDIANEGPEEGPDEQTGSSAGPSHGIEVVATFVHFATGHFELSEVSSSKVCRSAPAALGDVASDEHSDHDWSQA